MISSHVHVTAILVAHNGAPFLPATLEALAAQTRAPDRILAIVTGDEDDSARVIARSVALRPKIGQAAGASFGEAVNLAVESLGDPGQDAATEWLWLLHDDAAPEAHALARLLDAVEKAPSVTVAGAKQMDAARPARLTGAGLSMTRSGSRFNAVGPDEVDQGQHDAHADTLGVNSAGMLVRRDAFEQVGGFDPALPGVGDDVDLGRRMWLAGHRVVTVPDARMLHETDEVESVSGPRAQVHARAYTRLKFAGSVALPFLAVWMVIAGLGRALGRLAAKDPSMAGAEVAAGVTAFAHPGLVRRGRRQVRSVGHVPASTVRPLLATPSQVRDVRRSERDAREAERERVRAGDPALEASGGDDSFEALDPGARTVGSAAGGLLAVLVSVGLSLLSLYSLLGVHAVQGGALLAPSRSLANLWDRAVGFWQPVQAGVPAAPDPFDLLTWLAGVVSFGHPQQALVLAYLLAMPLAALAAWFGLGAFTRSPGFRFLGALAWSVFPTLQVSLAQGRPGAVIVHVVAPLFLLALVRAVGAARGEGALPESSGIGRAGTPSWTATACASLLGVVLVAAEPVLIVALVLGCGVAALVSRRARSLWFVPVPAVVVSLPLLVAAVQDPRTLLVQPGAPTPSDPAPFWQMLLGWPERVQATGPLPGFEILGQGPWPLIAVAVLVLPLLLMAAIALVSPARRSGPARALVCAALVLLIGAWGLGLLYAAVRGTDAVHPYLGSFVSLFGAAVLLAAGTRREALMGQRGGRRAPARLRTLAAIASVAVAVCVAASAVLWAAPRLVPGQDSVDSLGTAQLVHGTGPVELPATVVDRGLGQFAERTLQLRVGSEGRIEATLVSGDGVRLDDLSGPASARRLTGSVFDPAQTGRAPATPGEDAVRRAVASLNSGEEIDARQDLTLLGVSHVVLASGGTDADVVAQQLDAVPGLARIARGEQDQMWLWRVEPLGNSAQAVKDTGVPTSRVRIVDRDGATQALVPSSGADVHGYRVPSGEEGRRLVLAESADPGWRASVDGKALPAASQEWAQAFELPAAGGTLTVSYVNPWQWPWMILAALALAVALVSVLPVPRAWRGDAGTRKNYRPSVPERRAAQARAEREAWRRREEEREREEAQRAPSAENLDAEPAAGQAARKESE